MTWRDEADHAEIAAIIAVGEGLKKRNLFVGEGLADRERKNDREPDPPHGHLGLGTTAGESS